MINKCKLKSLANLILQPLSLNGILTSRIFTTSRVGDVTKEQCTTKRFNEQD